MDTKRNARSFLSGLQLADSALPIGRFAYSYGLESFLAGNPAIKADELTEIIQSIVLNSIGPLDGVAVAVSHRAENLGKLESLLELDHMVTVRKIAPVSRLASQACGRQLAGLAVSLLEGQANTDYLNKVIREEAAGNIGVVMGAVSANLGVDLTQAVLIELRDSVSSLFSAAIRLGRITAHQAQVGLRKCEPAIIAACEKALAAAAEDMYSMMPMLEVHSMMHEYADIRMFRS